MGYGNSPLTYVVSPDEEVVFELVHPLDMVARLVIPKGGINKPAEVTFCASLLDKPIDLKAKLVVASDVFEIEFPDDVTLTDIQLTIPMYEWTGDIKHIRLFEQDRGERWQRTGGCKTVMASNGKEVDHFEIHKAQHWSYYVVAYEIP